MLTVKNENTTEMIQEGKISLPRNDQCYWFRVCLPVFLKEFLEESFTDSPLLHIHQFELDASPVFSDNTSCLFNHHTLHTIL